MSIWYKFGFLLVVLSFSLKAYADGKEKIHYKAIFTNGVEKKVELTKFHCVDKIFLNFWWYDLKGDYSLKVNWFRPDGRHQEVTESKFSVITSKEVNTSMWLKLKKAKSLMPESGWDDFIGKWNVDIYLNLEFLGRKNFFVIC